MEPMFRTKNIGGGEAIFRSIFGVILVILAVFVSEWYRWIVGLIGVVIILTVIFGY